MPGGPNDNNRMLLIAGKLDFFMSANTLQSFDAVDQQRAAGRGRRHLPEGSAGLPDPSGVQGHQLEDLKPLTLFVSKEGISTYFQWLKSEYGFSEAKVKPYTFNPQPFLADKQSAMQGYVTSEPFAIEKAAGFKPGVILLADYGFNAYSTLIETRRDLIDKKPDLVQRFVDASIIGWYHYLYGDNAPGNAMIKKLNPEMTDELLAYSVAKMKEYGIVDSGDTLRDGIGAMNDARVSGLLRQDGACRRRAQRHRLPQGLHVALCQQGCRPGSAAKELESMIDSAASSDIATGPAGLATSLRGVTKVYDSGVKALGPIDLDVGRGEFVSLLGPSGCGKSTALRLIAGLNAPTSGTVEVARRSGQARAGHSIGFVFPGADADAMGQRLRQCAAAAETGEHAGRGGQRARRPMR